MHQSPGVLDWFTCEAVVEITGPAIAEQQNYKCKCDVQDKRKENYDLLYVKNTGLKTALILLMFRLKFPSYM